MTDAPRRVWLWRNEPGGELVVSGPDQPYPDTAIEYVRADLLPLWQPIETAPKDGKPHDIWTPTPEGGRRTADVIYITPEKCPEGTGYWVLVDDPEWFVTAIDEDYPPTHWMPHPAPPTE